MTREDFVDEYEDRQAAGEAWDQAFSEVCVDDLSLREAFGEAEDRFMDIIGRNICLLHEEGPYVANRMRTLGNATFLAILPYLFKLTKDRAEDLLPKYMPDETDRKNERELRNAG